MFQAILLASYGGPEKIEDVEPFLNNIFSTTNIPAARQEAVFSRYRRFNGISPLPKECRNFCANLKAAAERRNQQLRIYQGNLFFPPTFDDAFDQLESDGVESALVFATSAFAAFQSCKRYREAVLQAFKKRSEVFKRSFKLAFVPPFFDLPAMKRAVADDLLTALAWEDLEDAPFKKQVETREPTRLILFSAHSIPVISGDESQYRRQLLSCASATLQSILAAPGFGGTPDKARDISDASLSDFPKRNLSFLAKRNAVDFPSDIRACLRAFSLDAALVFQSRSGSPRTPWLEPDAACYLRQYKQEHPQLEKVIVSPIGFFFENMETIYDLDEKLRGVCGELNLGYRRAPCCGASPRFIDVVLDLAKLDFNLFPVCAASDGTCDLSCRFGGQN